MRKVFSLLVLLVCWFQSFAATIAVPADYSTIAAAITAATNGDTVLLSAGTYQENVLVDKEITLQGVNRSTVIIQPSFVGANTGGGSLGAGVSSVILVQADNVTVSTLTVDGDNPSLTSGEVYGGADIDARNGIITDHTTGLYNNLTVTGCLAKNIWLRGIYASSGGSFLFEGNEVHNVQADLQSIGMFNFFGSGIFRNNLVYDCNDAIASNWSSGTLYEGNEVYNSSSGIHTDNNGGAGGYADTIQNNFVHDAGYTGYGIWVFVPYLPVVVQDNTISNAYVGMACAGRGGASSVLSVFTRNMIDGSFRPNSFGLVVTTSQFGYGSNSVDLLFKENTVTRTVDDAINLEAQAGFVVSVTASFNRIANLSSAALNAVNLGGTYVGSWEHNWWGCNNGPACASVSSVVDATPWLVLDSVSADAQLASGAITDVTARILYDSDGADVSSLGRIPSVPVSFQSTLGSILPASATLSSGSADAQFTAGFTGGFASVVSSVDSASAEILIEVISPTATPTATPTITSTVTSTPTASPTSTNTPLPTPTYTLTSTSTPLPTNTAVPTSTSVPLPTATPGEASLGVEEWALYQ